MLTAIVCLVFAGLMIASVRIYARFRDNVTKAFLADVLKREPTPNEIAESEQEVERIMAQVPGFHLF